MRAYAGDGCSSAGAAGCGRGSASHTVFSIALRLSGPLKHLTRDRPHDVADRRCAMSS